MRLRPAVLAALLVTLGSVAEAAPALRSTTLNVIFTSRPEVSYNRLGDSLLSATTVVGTQTVKLSSGTPDPDDDHYWTALDPVSLTLRLPAGRQSVTLRTTLFVCDTTRGLCSVRRQEKRIQITADQRLEIVWDALNLSLGP